MPEAENRNATISKLSDSINNDQLAIEALSKEATDVSTEYKSSILFLMTDIFTALKTLADSVAGDYDSRTRKDSSTKVTISATLMSNIKDCEAKSFSGSEKVQSDVLKVQATSVTLEGLSVANSGSRSSTFALISVH